MPAEQRWVPPVGPTKIEKWLLFCIEAAFNKGLELSPELLSAVRSQAGKVISIKLRDPFYACYLLVSKDGVHLSYRHKGKIDARIRAKSVDMAWYFIGPEILKLDSQPKMHLVGDDGLLSLIDAFMSHWSFWKICRDLLGEWLPEVKNLDALFLALKRNDPVWLEHLEKVPSLIEDLMAELRQQSDIQAKQLEVLATMQKTLLIQQRQICCLVFLLMVIIVFFWFR